MSAIDPTLPEMPVSQDDRLVHTAPGEDTVRSRAATARQVFAQPRPRRNLIIAATVVIVVFVVGINWLLSGKKPQDATPVAKSSVPGAPINNTIPGTSTNAQYNKLVNEENARAAATAQRQGQSSVPVLANPDQTGSVLSLPVAPAVPATPTAASTTLPSALASAAPANLPPTQAQRAMASDVQSQIQFYLGTWKPMPAQVEFNAYGKQAATAVATDAAATKTAATKTTGARFVQAGTVVPAELLTPINSDHPGPVLAEIVAGPLRGSRVMGTFTTSANRVIVTFNTIAIPGANKSYTIRAFAVNANTASTALATDVNHHYLEKYGLLLASAFVSGYGQAVANQGAVVSVSPLGGYTAFNPSLNNHQILMSALGNVGTQVGSLAQANAQGIQPTVRVAGPHGSPEPIGLLFMQDF